MSLAGLMMAAEKGGSRHPSRHCREDPHTGRPERSDQGIAVPISHWHITPGDSPLSRTNPRPCPRSSLRSDRLPNPDQQPDLAPLDLAHARELACPGRPIHDSKLPITGQVVTRQNRARRARSRAGEPSPEGEGMGRRTEPGGRGDGPVGTGKAEARGRGPAIGRPREATDRREGADRFIE